ncbi:MAG TPA: universal stress protein [Solirubrobacteraceae bacterium]|nr:universal stress protein [Solirubrobacteraceae bacterium]
MILIGYDGSDNAKEAIEHAGALFGGQPAIVLSVWEPFSGIVARTPSSLGFAGIADYEAIDQASRNSANHDAEEGAALARGAGLDASARIATRAGPVAQTILNEADAVDAAAIVLGTRGLGGVGSLLLGSVSHALVQSADRPVLIVPSAELSESRTEKRRGRD